MMKQDWPLLNYFLLSLPTFACIIIVFKLPSLFSRSADSFANIIHLFQGWKIAIKTLIFVWSIVCCYHRLLGYALTLYLNSKLLRSDGAFAMTFGSIVVRTGLDTNEILFSDFLWDNPRAFGKKTPFFLKIKKFRIVFDLRSLLKAIITRNRVEVKVDFMKIRDVVVYVERNDTSGELNYVAAVGSTKEKSSRASFTASLTRALYAVALASNKFDKDDASLIHTISSGGSDSSAAASSSENPQPPLSRTVSPPSHQLNDSKNTKPWNYSHWGIPFRFDVAELSVKNITVYGQEYLAASTATAATAASSSEKNPSSLSFLSPIELPRLVLSKAALKATTPREDGDQGEGLYLDELGWRLIGKLWTDVISANKMSVSTMIASAAVTQTSAAITSAAAHTSMAMYDATCALGSVTFSTKQAALSTTNVARAAASQASAAVGYMGSVANHTSQAVFGDKFKSYISSSEQT